MPSQHCPTHVYRTNVMQIIGDQRITNECSGVVGPGQFIVGSTFDIMVERSREPLSRLPLKIRNIIAAADASHARRSPLNSGRDAPVVSIYTRALNRTGRLCGPRAK